jgi:hypothetical protein
MATWNLTTTEGNSVNQTQVWNFGNNQITLQKTFESGLFAINLQEGYVTEVPEGLIPIEDDIGELTYNMNNRWGFNIADYYGQNVSNVEIVNLSNTQSTNLVFSNNMSQSEMDYLTNLFNNEGVSGWANVGYTKTDEDLDLVGVLRIDWVDSGNGG